MTPVTASPQTTIRNQTGGVVKITVGAGANIVYFDNEPVGPPQSGILEVCKDAGDQFVPLNKSVAFTITDTAGLNDTENVLPGQCSGPVTVAAGNINVAENIPNGEFVSDIFLGLNSAGQLGPTNLNNGTTVVVVPVAAAGDTQVHFRNSTFLTTLKVCKYLTASSGGLDGTRFNFTVKDAAGTQTVRIVANTSVNGACKNVTDAANSNGGNLIQVPVGSDVTVTEAGLPFVAVDGGAPGAGGTQTITAATGINTISFHNQAYGQFEICKNIGGGLDGDPSFNETVFSFVVNGDTAHPVPIAAGRCGEPIVLPAGTVTLTETPLPYGFAFLSSTATGPLGQNRCLPPVANCGNPMTFTVPYFNDPTSGGETSVTVVNSVQRATVKICKLIDPGSAAAIGSTDFSFNVLVNGVPKILGVTVKHPYPGPSSCTDLLLNIPVINADGSPVKITVQEVAQTGVGVQGVTVSQIAPIPPGSAPTVVTGPGGSITFNPAVGNADVTFTNVAVPSLVYDAIPNPLPPNTPSQAFQATQTSEFGDYIHLAGTARLARTVTVMMSDWVPFSDWSGDPRYSGNSATWTHPITINVYSNHLDANNHPDVLLGTITQTITIPWRPPATPALCGGDTGAWQASDGNCYHGIAFNAVFDLSSLSLVLPTDVIIGIAYNTQTYGATPIGIPGAYNSLNVAVPNNEPVFVGSDNNTDATFLSSITPGQYNSPGATGIFRLDTGWTPNGTLALRITAI